jgi:hypothetical protein
MTMLAGILTLCVRTGVGAGSAAEAPTAVKAQL